MGSWKKLKWNISFLRIFVLFTSGNTIKWNVLELFVQKHVYELSSQT